MGAAVGGVCGAEPVSAPAEAKAEAGAVADKSVVVRWGDDTEEEEEVMGCVVLSGLTESEAAVTFVAEATDADVMVVPESNAAEPGVGLAVSRRLGNASAPP